MDIAELINEYKNKYNKTYRQIAVEWSVLARVPVSYGSICNWALGKYTPSLLFMRELARNTDGPLRLMALEVLDLLEGKDAQ